MHLEIMQKILYYEVTLKLYSETKAYKNKRAVLFKKEKQEKS